MRFLTSLPVSITSSVIRPVCVQTEQGPAYIGGSQIGFYTKATRAGRGAGPNAFWFWYECFPIYTAQDSKFQSVLLWEPDVTGIYLTPPPPPKTKIPYIYSIIKVKLKLL